MTLTPQASTRSQANADEDIRLEGLFNRAATFNLYVPGIVGVNAAIRFNGVFSGISINQPIHRFLVETQYPDKRGGLISSNLIEERIGNIEARWLYIPAGYYALPHLSPPPIPADPSQSQRFVMQDMLFTFRNEKDGFHAFGTGLTIPSNPHRGDETPAVAIATPLKGFGQFNGHDIGICTFVGTISSSYGFRGNCLIRMWDPQDIFRGAIAETFNTSPLEPGITYAIFRGQATPDQAVKLLTDASGHTGGLIVAQHLQLCHIDCSDRSSTGLRSYEDIGPLIGNITARINFDPGSAMGTPLDPIPDTATCDWVFARNGETIGSFKTQWYEGRTINFSEPGFQAVRFGNVGPILCGTGAFSDIQGLMTDNSFVSFNPHVGVSIYVMRIYDPDNKYRKAFCCQ